MPKFSVLIIEDEKNIQTFMGKVLKRHDYQVLYADTGKQGLEMIRSRCPDLILLDLGLPDMDGCSIIRDVRTWASTPIIVISARTAEREKVAALDLGADDYITKPFGTSELLARIRASLRHSNRLLTDSTGGEKALTAISLLFAIQNLKPSPFCLLDEIEAALDDNNVTRFAQYLHKLTKNTQFIVITHRRGTMTAADRLYGITMQEKGVSTLVSVDLLEDKLDR